MLEADHVRLLDTLANIEGKFLLSGYRSELYDRHAARCEWHRHEKTIDNKASSGKSKERRIECLWSNLGPPEQQKGGTSRTGD